jgi:hypothetical protein
VLVPQFPQQAELVVVEEVVVQGGGHGQVTADEAPPGAGPVVRGGELCRAERTEGAGQQVLGGVATA